METAVAFAVLLEVLQGHVAVFVEHATGFKERFGILLEVVVIDKVVARVVRRVDVNHLDLAQVVVLEQFEHFEVVAFDVEVLRVIEIDGFLFAGAERHRGWGVRLADGVALAGPVELVAFLLPFDHFAVDFLHEQVLVDGTDRVSVLVERFRDAVREQRLELLKVLACHIRSLHLQFLGHIRSSRIKIMLAGFSNM